MKIKSRSMNEVDINGKIIIIKEKSLLPKYRTLANRFYRATGGFGCSPSSLGSALFTKEMFGQLEERWQRSDFEGWMTDEEFEAFCEKHSLAWAVLKNECEVSTV